MSVTNIEFVGATDTPPDIIVVFNSKYYDEDYVRESYNEFDSKGFHTGFDIKSVEPVTFNVIRINDYYILEKPVKLLPTGIKIIATKDFYTRFVPRSGLSLKTLFRIANTPATIEPQFRGEVKILADLSLLNPYLITAKSIDDIETIVNTYLKDIAKLRVFKAKNEINIVLEPRKYAQVIFEKRHINDYIQDTKYNNICDANVIFGITDDNIFEIIGEKIFKTDRGDKGYGSTGM